MCSQHWVTSLGSLFSGRECNHRRRNDPPQSSGFIVVTGAWVTRAAAKLQRPPMFFHACMGGNSGKLQAKSSGGYMQAVILLNRHFSSRRCLLLVRPQGGVSCALPLSYEFSEPLPPRPALWERLFHSKGKSYTRGRYRILSPTIRGLWGTI